VSGGGIDADVDVLSESANAGSEEKWQDQSHDWKSIKCRGVGSREWSVRAEEMGDCVKQTAGPSTMLLAMRLREATLRRHDAGIRDREAKAGSSVSLRNDKARAVRAFARIPTHAIRPHVWAPG
jgi:hypothetical protein